MSEFPDRMRRTECLTMTPEILAVIPARFASVRFPGKPLADICGKPMIQWVYEAASQSPSFARTVIATDDQRIASAAELFDAEVIMTRNDHETGTDRLCEVAEMFPAFDVYVNVQGDQPFVSTDALNRLVEPFANADPPEMATLACPLTEEAQNDPNSVKVICDRNMNAIYFSRANIPHRRSDLPAPVYHHLGLYAYEKSFVKKFQQYKPTPLEQCEQLEQLRALENGHSIRVSLIESALVEVNTPEDLEVANLAMAKLEIES